MLQLDDSELKTIENRYRGKDVDVILLIKMIEELRNRAISYICGKCGGFAYTQFDSLDSGTTFTCETCNGKTVVLLFEKDQYVTWSKTYAELIRAHKLNP